MKHLYRITWSDGFVHRSVSKYAPYELFNMYKGNDEPYPVVIERL